MQIMRLAEVRANAPATLLDALNVGVAVIDREQTLDSLLGAEKTAIEHASAIELTELRQNVTDSLATVGVPADAIAKFIGADDRPSGKPDALTRKVWFRLTQFADDRAMLMLAASHLAGTETSEPLTVKMLRAAQGSSDPEVQLQLGALTTSGARVGRHLDELLVWSRRKALGGSARGGPAAAWRWAEAQRPSGAGSPTERARRAAAFVRKAWETATWSPVGLHRMVIAFEQNLPEALELAALVWNGATADDAVAPTTGAAS